jgi:hypothetical protein
MMLSLTPVACVKNLRVGCVKNLVHEVSVNQASPML